MDPVWRSNPEQQFKDKWIDLADFARNEYGHFWITDEGIAAMEFLEEKFPKGGNGMIEIGSAYGASFHCWAQFFSAPRISVDVPWGSWLADRAMIDERLAKWHKNLGSDDLHQVIGDSTLPETVERVATILDGRQVDWLFIDANHDYEPSLFEYQNYGQFVRKGGYIGFHDIFHHAHVEGCGRTFREAHGEKWTTDWHWTGIGIVRVE